MADIVSKSLEKAVAEYKMPASAKDLLGKSDLLLLCGVTAAGKNTLTQYLVAHEGYEHVVSHTTRKPRENHGIAEKNGTDYWFVNNAQMLQLVQLQKFAEVKKVHELYYATSIEAVERVVRHGKHPIIEIDVQGAQELMRAVPVLRAIFLIPPNHDVWMQRLYNRGQVSDEELKRRMTSAREEINTALADESFDIVVNHEVADTAAAILDRAAFMTTNESQAQTIARQLLRDIKKY